MCIASTAAWGLWNLHWIPTFTYGSLYSLFHFSLFAWRAYFQSGMSILTVKMGIQVPIWGMATYIHLTIKYSCMYCYVRKKKGKEKHVTSMFCETGTICCMYRSLVKERPPPTFGQGSCVGSKLNEHPLWSCFCAINGVHSWSWSRIASGAKDIWGMKLCYTWLKFITRLLYVDRLVNPASYTTHMVIWCHCTQIGRNALYGTCNTIVKPRTNFRLASLPLSPQRISL